MKIVYKIFWEKVVIPNRRGSQRLIFFNILIVHIQCSHIQKQFSHNIKNPRSRCLLKLKTLFRFFQNRGCFSKNIFVSIC